MVKFNHLENLTSVTMYEILEQYTIIKYVYYSTNSDQALLINQLKKLDFVDDITTVNDIITITTNNIIVTIDNNGINNYFTIYHTSGPEIWDTMEKCEISILQIIDALNTIDIIFN